MPKDIEKLLLRMIVFLSPDLLQDRLLSKNLSKDYMEKHYKGVLDLLELICQKCSLVLYKDCLVIDCDGRDSACEFVLTKEAYEERDR